MPKANHPKLDTEFHKAEESPGFLLWKAANLLQRMHTKALREVEATPAQFSFMTCLVFLTQNEDVTPIMISRHAGMDKMMVSDLVKTLKSKKLLTTQKNPDDGRSFILKPTEKGIKITNQAIKAVESLDADFFSAVGNLKILKKELLGLIHKEESRQQG